MIIPEEIVSFLSEVITKPRLIDIGYEQFEFPKAEDIIELQFGYKWDGNTKKNLSDWHENWVVIGHSKADPLIYDSMVKRGSRHLTSITICFILI